MKISTNINLNLLVQLSKRLISQVFLSAYVIATVNRKWCDRVQLGYSLVHEQGLTICPVLGEYVQRRWPGAALSRADNTHRFQRST